MYDDVPEGVTLICYADDLVTVITAANIEELQMMSKIKLWLTKNKLNRALKKSKAIILNRISVFEQDHNKIVPELVVKYLGIPKPRSWIKFLEI